MILFGSSASDINSRGCQEMTQIQIDRTKPIRPKNESDLILSTKAKPTLGPAIIFYHIPILPYQQASPKFSHLAKI